MGQAEVLVIEDNPADRFWLEYLLKLLGKDVALSFVTDGEQAVSFLLKRGEYCHAPTPDVIFLDVHLPTLDGIEVLRQLPNARELPICVLTSSEGEREMFETEFGIARSDYLIKPASQAGIAASPQCRAHLLPHSQRFDAAL